MPVVYFERTGLTVEVPEGSTILAAARAAGAPEASRCGAVCACSTCHVYVRSGLDGMAPPSQTELDLLARARDRRPESRLGCQVVLPADADVVVEISEESFEVYVDTHPEDAQRALELWLGARDSLT
jgi:2Fe-2S ferredoxin